MSGHSTEQVMELSLDVDSDDRVLPSDPDDYDYDYQDVYVFLREYKVISLTAVLTLETVLMATVMTIFTCKNNILPKTSLTSP